jgi:serine protease Do
VGPVIHGRLAEPAWAATETAQQGPAGFAALVAKVRPAVISVRVKMEENTDGGVFSDNPFKGTPFEKFFHQYGFDGGPKLHHHEIITGVGSGFFISPDGYAVTNNHVVDHAKSVQVTTDDGTVYTAKVVGTDPKTDLALIKVDGKKDFTYVSLATKKPRVGDWVVAVGNPYGLGGTVTAGIVSAEGREISSSPYDDYIQIDAPINKGNSGGPTFNTEGKVIGVNTAIYSPSGGSVGIGFDIPADTVQEIVAQLKAKGKVTRAWLGVEVQPVTSGIAESLGLEKAQGALVDQIEPNTPAAKAGLKPGDVITAVNGKTVKDSRGLARQISIMAPGSTAKIDVLRKGESKTIDVALATMPSNLKVANAGHENHQTRGVPHLGMSVASASDVAGAGNKGVVVTSVDPDGKAAAHGLESGDVILDVAGQSVGTPGQLRRALVDAKSSGKHNVLMRVKTANNTHFVAIPIG